MSNVIAAVLLGPDRELWPFVYEKAQSWADDFAILEDLEGRAWGNEAEYRAALWDDAVSKCSTDDWIFVLDSDFVLTFDPHELTGVSDNIVGWRFDLYDLWDADHYREDNFWRAHCLPRPWMFRASASPVKPEWNPRGIHVGHFPNNFMDRRHAGLAPGRMAILHLGWITPEIRQRKYEAYKRVWQQLSEFERQHVESILDPEPSLRKLCGLGYHIEGLLENR